MSSLNSRVYSTPADLQVMIALIQKLRAGGQRVYPIAADLYEELAEPSAQASARLWENERGEALGFVYVNRYHSMVDVFDAGALTPSVEKEMVDWAVVAAQRLNQERGGGCSLEASTLDDDLPRMAFLERHGFLRQKNSSILLACPIEQPLPQPQLPEGFHIRTMGGEAELEAYVALHRAAFGTENMTVEYRRTIMNVPSYIPELDLVAVAPDGQLAAFCVCQIFPDDAPRAGGTKEGWTDPLGTHPDFRRLGLAKALMQHGMRLLQARGIDTALLGTDSDNTAMQLTAEAAGFHVNSKTLFYCKTI